MRKKLLFLLVFLVGAIIVISLVAYQKDKNKSGKIKQSFGGSFGSEKWLYGDGDAPYGNIIATQRLRKERIKRETDSIVARIDLSTVRIIRDSIWAKVYLSPEEGTIPLWRIYRYFAGAHLFQGEMTIYLSEMSEKLKKYLGFKQSSQKAWESSMKKMIKKFSPALSRTEKRAVSKSLLAHAELIEKLTQLSDIDQSNLIKLLDTIVTQQSADGDWIYYGTGSERILISEYDILKKIWLMPKLVKGGGRGHIYYLGKYVEYPWKEDADYPLMWNTRYLCKYQYSVAIWHRRCRDVYANTPQQRRDVALKISSLLKEAAAML